MTVNDICFLNVNDLSLLTVLGASSIKYMMELSWKVILATHMHDFNLYLCPLPRGKSKKINLSCSNILHTAGKERKTKIIQ